jgi:hypothetical protein
LGKDAALCLTCNSFALRGSSNCAVFKLSRKGGINMANIPFSQMTDEQQIVSQWGAAGVAVLDIARGIDLGGIPVSDFTAEYCVMQGGDWGAWLLSGIKTVSRKLFNAVPAHMGRHAFFIICAVLRIMNVDTAN